MSAASVATGCNRVVDCAKGPGQRPARLLDLFPPGFPGTPRKGTSMARTIWTGALSFGLVNVPVGLYSATQDKSVRFNQFQAGTSDRVRIKRVNERTGDEVP